MPLSRVSEGLITFIKYGLFWSSFFLANQLHGGACFRKTIMRAYGRERNLCLSGGGVGHLVLAQWAGTNQEPATSRQAPPITICGLSIAFGANAVIP